MNKFHFLLILFVSVYIIAAWNAGTSAVTNQPVEVGLVNWNRNYKEALQRSEKEGKPVFTLFQEVPGCSGTKKFGKEVLSHPLIVEAIEEEFIPLLIYNNQDGKDAYLLSYYDEPAWNFQVIRFFNSSGKDIIPRKDRVWSLGAVAYRMVEALRKAGKNVPIYLQGIALENNNPNLKEAAFAMYCFWTGEMNLGGIEGVVKTQAGFFDHREVTRVWYDKSVISLEDLASKAAEFECADAVYLINKKESERLNAIKALKLPIRLFNEKKYKKAGISDQKKQIQGSVFMDLGLTQFQLTKVNAFAHRNREKALEYLSPKQAARFHMLLKDTAQKNN